MTTDVTMKKRPQHSQTIGSCHNIYPIIKKLQFNSRIRYVGCGSVKEQPL